MKNIKTLFLVLIVLNLIPSKPAQAQVPASDSLALVALYDATAGDSWKNNTNWKSATVPVGSWYGVSVFNGKVHQIVLGSNNLTGQVPTQIGDLYALERLDLNSNNLQGNIPTSIGNLANLNYLNLSYNHFPYTAFPTNIGQLASLQYLVLTGCDMTLVPLNIFDLTSLQSLSLGYNQISEVPYQLENLGSLQSLDLTGNPLNGNLPSQLFKLNYLTTLFIGDVGLTELPSFLTDMAWVQDLQVWGNDLDESDMLNIGNMAALETLNLNSNPFQAFPNEIVSLTNLRQLYLSNNQISNSSLGNLGDMTGLETLGLNGAQLSTVPAFIFNFSQLGYLDLSYNHIGGPIPEELGGLPLLYTLYLNNNQFSGDVPAGFADLANLNRVLLNDNYLEGLPKFSTANGMNVLNIANNNFTFEDIEPNLGVASNFLYSPQRPVGSGMDSVLVLGSSITLDVTVGGANNQYQWFKNDAILTNATNSSLQVNLNSASDFGKYQLRITNTQATDLELLSLPFNLVQDNQIEQDSLALVNLYNSLNGTNWNNQNGWLSAPVAQWQGVVVQNNRVVELHLAGNNLGGTIPAAIGDLSALKILELNNNALLGFVPTEIVNLAALEEFYLQDNQLEGIPDLHSLSKLKTLKIENNKFFFIDIEPNLGAASVNYTYAPQDSIYLVPSVYGGLGDQIFIEVPTTSPKNTYSWYKNGGVIGSDLNPYEIGFLSYNDQGSYRCEVSNSLITDLVLHSTAVQVEVHEVPLVYANSGLVVLPRTAEIPFQVHPGGLETTVQIDYGFSSAYGQTAYWQQQPFTGISLISRTMTLTDLEPARTYHYKVRADNSMGFTETLDQVFSTPDYPEVLNITHHIDLPANDKPADYSSDEYRMIGLPGAADLPVADIFSGSPWDDWLAYWDNGEPSDYFVEWDENGDFNFQLGRAFWVVSLHGADINKSINSAPLNPLSQASIPLHDGWNIITNPFNQNISWNDVSVLNGFSGISLYRFNGTFQVVSQMEPFEGYLFNVPAGTNQLLVPYPGSTVTKTVAKNNSVPGEGWELNLVLESEGLKDATTRLGVRRSADNGTIKNYKKPRARGNILNIYFNHPEWDEQQPAYVTDFRADDNELQIWKINSHLFPGKEASLSVLQMDQLPLDKEIYLIQREQGKSWDLRQANSISFIPRNAENLFEIAVANQDQMQDVLAEVVPSIFAVDQNYPNPFNPSTLIRYQLASDGEVGVIVFNALGQKVATLVNRFQNAGNYSVQFDGSQLPSGVYFYRLLTPEFSQTKKMILIR